MLDALSILYVFVVFVSPISAEIMQAGAFSIILIILFDIFLPILIAYRLKNRLKEYAKLRKQKMQKSK